MNPSDLIPPGSVPDQAHPSLVRRLEMVRSRLNAPPAVSGEVLRRRAESLFRKAFGEEAQAETVGLGACAPLSAEHTQFYPGFGFYLSMPGGVAVSAECGGTDFHVRTSCIGRSAASAKPFTDIVRRLVEVISRDCGPLCLAVTQAGPLLGDTTIAAVAYGAVCCLSPENEEEELVERARRACAAATGGPFGRAHFAALSISAPAGKYVLVDGESGTAHIVSPDEKDTLGWALVETGGTVDAGGDELTHRAGLLEAAHQQLLSGGYAGVSSLRDIDHRDLPAALQLLNVKEASVVRHLVSEDRRVMRLVMMLKRPGGQLLGATLSMSQASQRDDWLGDVPEVAYILDRAVEVEGVFGGRQLDGGRSGALLLVGRPYLLADFLDGLIIPFRNAYNRELTITLL
ncbi:hypothetical protein BH23BAC4_BH23BAC4_10180 [soil metagenome]